MMTIMKGNRRAQSALEYLMSYGWAILIVIVVSAALFSLGAFNPSAWTGKSASGFQDLTIADFKVSGTTVTLVIGANRDNPITLTAGSATCEGSLGTVLGSAGQILPSEKDEITISGFSSIPQGSPYKCNVTLTYRDDKTLVTHTSAGMLRGKAE